MPKVKMKTGDVFFVRKSGIVHSIIDLVQSFYSKDKCSYTNHAGIIISNSGITFETSKWKTGFNSIHRYFETNTPIIIFRHYEELTNKYFISGYDKISYNKGLIFPYWRWLLHLFGIQRLVHGESMECSVMTAAFIKGCGVPLKRFSWDYNVDMLYDELFSTPMWKVVSASKNFFDIK
ncbi:MAG: hypothetical protein ACTSPQ_15110 [Candidatus Helarchaeota archaeon]